MTDGATSDAAPVGRNPRQRLESAFLRLNEHLWWLLPARVRDLRPLRAYGTLLHALVGRCADREMYLGTWFLRNRPALELLRRLVDEKERGSRVDIAVLGCSIGVEVYSIVWTLRSHRPDLQLVVHGVDISPDVLRVAERGVYSSDDSDMVHSSIFEGLTKTEREEMFDWNGEQGRIQPWLREGITWHLGDASDTSLVADLGPHDVVVANNFLCHMPPPSAEACLRNFAGLVRPRGYLLVTGVDLDVRTKVARDLAWQAVPDLRTEIHDGDPLVRADWPWQWWGLEPLDRRRRDWEMRYSAAFRIRADAASRA